MSRTPAAHGQRGFTLVELMVALVIGLLLLAGVLQILLSNRASFDAQRATAHLQENVRYSDFLISHAIAHAGYRTQLDRSLGRIFPPSEGAAPRYAARAYITGQTGSGTESDELRIRFQAEGGVRDCLGGQVGAVGVPETSDFKFYVNANRSLLCQKYHMDGTPAGVAQPIVENVDRFNVRYGLQVSDTPLRYRYVDTLDNGQAANVRSVRIQLLMHSRDDDPALSSPIKRDYTFADGQTIQIDDRRAYVFLDRTIAIENPPQ
ncbi:PilW family protein [Salinisphaera sp. SPP-AMP-43]|uniref:PilW family protein n=1 Tax=Salinisphaera sp. SPP-AMP-43 TaxID=3121288 RepID=UPI003C6E7BD3